MQCCLEPIRTEHVFMLSNLGLEGAVTTRAVPDCVPKRVLCGRRTLHQMHVEVLVD